MRENRQHVRRRRGRSAGSNHPGILVKVGRPGGRPLGKSGAAIDSAREVFAHYHASLEGGHQGIARTYVRVKAHFHWRGMYRDVQNWVRECVDCATGKGRPTIRGRSPGNIVGSYPFQVVAMDFIPSLPASYNGNTELLLFVDLHTGYAIAKASASRTAGATAPSTRRRLRAPARRPLSCRRVQLQLLVNTSARFTSPPGL